MRPAGRMREHISRSVSDTDSASARLQNERNGGDYEARLPLTVRADAAGAHEDVSGLSERRFPLGR
jgi:hypothetical protein